jgi:hypothetical protein
VFSFKADTMAISYFLDGATKASDAATRSAWTDRAHALEDTISANQRLSKPLPLWGSYFDPDRAGQAIMAPNARVQWPKPILVLTDALTASCADWFAKIIQTDGIGKTFGARTMGAGGSVQQVLTLPYSRMKMYATRSLVSIAAADGSDGAPADADLIENNGVTPDYPFDVTVADFRAGFIGYFEAFSHTATQLTR